jgi:hypothetical protein
MSFSLNHDLSPPPPLPCSSSKQQQQAAAATTTSSKQQQQQAASSSSSSSIWRSTALDFSSDLVQLVLDASAACFFYCTFAVVVTLKTYIVDP